MPPSIVRACFIHGVGQQGDDFADDARRWLRESLEEKRHTLFSTHVHWAPLADRHQERFLAAAEAKGSKGNPTQRLVVGTLADALMYTTNPRLRDQIYLSLDNQLFLLGGRGTIFAHSLGGLIVTDYLRTRPHVKNVRLVTMGCNIGLFNLGKKFEPVPQLEAPGSWINVFSPRDMLGFPLGIDPNLAHVRDVKVSVGGWFKGWTGLAHVRYWSDADLWKKTLPSLLGFK